MYQKSVHPQRFNFIFVPINIQIFKYSIMTRRFFKMKDKFLPIDERIHFYGTNLYNYYNYYYIYYNIYNNKGFCLRKCWNIDVHSE